MQQYLSGQNRFDQLKRADIEKAKSMQSFLNKEIHHRHERMQKLAMDDHELLDHLKKVSLLFLNPGNFACLKVFSTGHSHFCWQMRVGVLWGFFIVWCRGFIGIH